MGSGMRRLGLRRAALAGLAALAGGAAPAHARITRIEIATVSSPTFDGASFGAAGKYEKLAGRFFGEVDPADPLNALIADIRLAPRNARGMVEYSGDLLIIRPIDAAKGNHRLLFDINNRGNILSFGLFNDAAKNSNDPSTAADAGNGFMMRQGYTLVWGAWDAVSGTRPDVGGGPFLLDAPVARNPDGSDIVGPSLEEFVIDDDKTSVERLTYPAASLDTAKASSHVPRPGRTTSRRPSAPTNGATTPAARASASCPKGRSSNRACSTNWSIRPRIPKVAGLGFAATRDLAAFLHYADADDAGHPNPLAGAVRQVYTDLRLAAMPVHARLRGARVQPGRQPGAGRDRRPFAPQGDRRRPQLGRRRRAAFFSTIASPSRSAPIGSISPAGIPNSNSRSPIRRRQTP